MPFGSEVLGARGSDPAGRRDAGIVSEREVFGDRLRQDEALSLAVLGNEDNPVIECVSRSREIEDVAVDLDQAGGDRICARDGAHQLGAPRPDNARDAEDFAGSDREADVGEGALGARQAFDLDQGRRGRRRRDFWEHAIERPANHLLDQRLDRHLGGLVGRDEVPVAQDENPVRDAGDLVEAVADVDETDAFGLQPADLFEKPLGLFGA